MFPGGIGAISRSREFAVEFHRTALQRENEFVEKHSTQIISEEPELIADYACETGENPLWHPLERRLYWTDIPRGRLYRYNPADGSHEQCYQGRPVGGFTIQPDGSLLLFMDRGTIALLRDGALSEIVPEIPAERLSRFNDVIADPAGRVFCGTMPTGTSHGRLYRLDRDGSLHLVLEGIRCSNGMAFTADCKNFYYTDSFAREIYLFDYNVEDGSLSNQRLFARFPEEGGLPDGCTLDAEGRLWSALWDGSGIVRLRADGTVEKRINFPTLKTSSLVFGGDDYSDLYITTAGGEDKALNGKLAGGLFRLRGQGRGVPEFFSRIDTSSATSSHR
ncbi:MAG: SMP-30/gluconolactonase/LRE family protein [Acidobacteria bacterium]|nr:SMP-30/gluconolactonase/LRE family protein [Acidobacteriota bacterium]